MSNSSAHFWKDVKVFYHWYIFIQDNVENLKC